MSSLSPFIQNKQLNEIEFTEGKIILQSKPRSLRVILTNICNINCIMCESSFETNKFTIPYKFVEPIIEFFPYLEYINWQGGEIFLVDYFKDLLEKAFAYSNIRQEIQTNGLLIDDEWAELLMKYNVDLFFSIDGTTKETYEKIRKGANFEKLLRNISLVNRFKEKYKSHSYMTLCVCVMRSNYKELKEFISFAKEFKFQRVIFGLLRGKFVPKEDIFNPPDQEAIDYLRDIIPVIEKTCFENKIEFDYQFKSILRSEVDINTEKHYEANFKKCRFPWSQLHIDAIRRGNVYPDCMCQQSIGNLMQENIIDIWNGSLMQQYRRGALMGNSQNLCSEACNRKLVPENYFV